MSGYIEGISRDQVTLFPDRLEDWIDEDHPVRVIDAFVDAMDLAEAGFARMSPAQTGQSQHDGDRNAGTLVRRRGQGHRTRGRINSFGGGVSTSGRSRRARLCRSRC